MFALPCWGKMLLPQSAMSFECSCSISVRADVFAEQSSVSGSGTTAGASLRCRHSNRLALLALQHSLRSFVVVIRSWLMVPVLYQGRLLGMVELHHWPQLPYQWQEDEVALVEAIASQVGAALIQAEAYANLEPHPQQPDCHHRSRTPHSPFH